MTSWQRLGTVEPGTLVDARLQLHHAVQHVVSASISYLAPRADDSHTNFEWLPDLGALAGSALPSEGLRLAVRIAELELLALDAHGNVLSRTSLDGATNDDALAWLRGVLGARGLDVDRLTTRKHYEIPAHPVARGGAYSLDRASQGELAHQYHDAWLITTEVAKAELGASEPRCWPHHFDLATLLTLDKAPDGKQRTIGVGLSPGDDSYTEPYWYVGPNPYPPVNRLPRLEQGRWHTKGWTGAVLTTSELLRAAGPDGQRDRVMAYVREAIAACRAAFGSTASQS